VRAIKRSQRRNRDGNDFGADPVTGQNKQIHETNAVR